MIPGTTYHIYNHANGSENLFRENENYRYFLQQYKKYIYPIATAYTYCLLPNHFHLLLEIKEEDELKNLIGFKNLQILGGSKGLDNSIGKAFQEKTSKCFSNFFNSYAKAYNEKYSRKGSLFFQNFRRKPIESIEQWQETFLYIHLNPVKHGFTYKPEQWKWSSWNAYLQREKASFIDRNEVLEYFDTFENMIYCMERKRESIISSSME